MRSIPASPPVEALSRDHEYEASRSTPDCPGVGRLMAGLVIVSACLGTMLLSSDLAIRATGFLGIIGLTLIPRAALEVATKTSFEAFCKHRRGVVCRMVAIATGVPVAVCLVAVALR